MPLVTRPTFDVLQEELGRELHISAEEFCRRRGLEFDRGAFRRQTSQMTATTLTREVLTFGMDVWPADACPPQDGEKVIDMVRAAQPRSIPQVLGLRALAAALVLSLIAFGSITAEQPAKASETARFRHDTTISITEPSPLLSDAFG